MKKITFFRPVTKVAFAFLIASVVMVSCTKQELIRQPASNSMKSAFNAKLKMGGKDEINILDFPSPPTDTTKKAQ
jgi:hypothetical protein